MAEPDTMPADVDAAAPPAPAPTDAMQPATAALDASAPKDAAPEDDDAAFDAAFPEPKVTADMSDDDAFDTMFPEKHKPLRRGHGVTIGAVADLVRPMEPAEWANYLENAPAGRVISAFGDAFKGDGLSQEASKWLREHGIFNGVAEKDAAQNDSFGQAIMRPLVTQARWLNELAIEPLVQAFDYGLIRPIHAAMEAVEQIGAEAEKNPLYKPLAPQRLARDVAGMIELETTRGEIVPGVPHPAGEVPKAAPERIEPTFGRIAVPEEFHEPIKGFAQNRLAQLEAINKGNPERTIEGPDGKPMVVPATQGEFFTPAQKAEYDFLRQHADDPDAIIQGYQGLVDQLERQYRALPPEVADYRANAIIGESEHAFMGLETPTAEALAARRAAAADIPPPPSPAVEPPQAGPVTPPTPHEAARIAEPALFTEYDTLEAQRADLSRWMRELRDDLPETISANPPAALAELDAKIADLERRAQNLGARRRGELDGQLDVLRDQRADMMNDLIINHPDMARVRAAYQKADSRMRDLAPEVSRARREAGEQVGTGEFAEPAANEGLGGEMSAPKAEPLATEKPDFASMTGAERMAEYARRNPPRPEFKSESLKAGDVVEHETLGRIEIIDVSPTGDRPGRWVEFRMEDGKEYGETSENFEDRLRPEPYTDANTGERKIGEPPVVKRADGTIERPYGEPQATENAVPASDQPNKAKRPENAPKEPPAAPLLDVAAGARAEVQRIIDDRVEQLTAAGYPRDVAQASAALEAAWYDTWSRRMKGTLGSPWDMYRANAPAIALGKTRGKYKVPELAQAVEDAAEKEGTHDLIIQHNLTAENLMHAERMGGIPVPSLAITKRTNPLHGFGEITLIGDTDMADPRGSMRTRAFGGDIYSPRYPSVEFNPKGPALAKMNEALAPFRKEGDREIYSAEITRPDDLVSVPAFKAYAAEKLGEKAGWHEMKALAEQMLRDAGAEERIFSGFTYSGNRRYKAHTLENVISILKKEMRSGEGFSYGVGNLRATVTPEFKSIAQIRKAKDRLVDKETFEGVKKEVDEDFWGIVNDVAPYSNRGKDFGFGDTMISVMQDAAKMGIPRALKEYGIEGVPEDVMAKMRDFMNKLRDLPTEYFEAKIMREVGVHEFPAAVVPDDLSPKVRETLAENGVKTFEYKRGDKADRERAVKEATEALGDKVLFQPGWHGSPHIFDKFTLDHIGTGEGAQAYGWGLYFAGDKSIAKYYREALTRDAPLVYDGKQVPRNSIRGRALATLQEKGREAAIKEIEDSIKFNRDYAPDLARLYEHDLAWIKDVDESKIEKANPGRLYKVNLKPAEHEWLDLDKPLAEQSDHVKAALKKLGVEHNDAKLPKIASPSVENIVRAALKADDNPEHVALTVDNDQALYNRAKRQMDARRISVDDVSPGEWIVEQAKEHLAARARREKSGMEVYQALEQKFGGAQNASLALRDAGIPGSRYLDAGSRDTLDGASHNYVLFDDALVEIQEFEQSAAATRTDTPEFKRWFDNSKVVDKDGEPLVVYHGRGRKVGPRGELMTGDFEQFDPSYSGLGANTGAPSGTYFFTERPDVAESYAVEWQGDFSKQYLDNANVMPVYLSLKNPLILSAKGNTWRDIEYKGQFRDINEIARLAKQSRHKYDGVIVKRVQDHGRGDVGKKRLSTTYIAFEPTQIKSVHNRGKWDGANANILEQSAWHGSPHIFDKFTLDHIGSGEGAQAYGHGLYFAGNKAVAKFYRENLSRQQRQPLFQGEKVDRSTFLGSAIMTLDHDAKRVGFEDARNDVLTDLRERLDQQSKPGKFGKLDDADLAELRDAITKISEAKESDVQTVLGRLYRVDLKPEFHEWLDWDMPLSEQSPEVQKALESFGHKYDAEGMAKHDDALLAALAEDGKGDLPKQPPNPSGSEIYHELRRKLGGAKAASDALHKAGIPGIKYAEGAARGAKRDLPGYIAEQKTKIEQARRTIAENNQRIADGGPKMLGLKAANDRLEKSIADWQQRIDDVHEHVGPEHHNFVVFNDDLINILEFEQQSRGGIRHSDPGKTPLDEGRKILRLAKTADASTFMHEISHAWLGDLMRFAERTDAPPDVKADADIIKKWLDVKGLDDLKAMDERGRFTRAARNANEKFARGWERYLMEGVAPSKELAGVFAKFRQWLTKIYQTLTRIKSPINDDVRGVFDRFLTTNPERVLIGDEAAQPRLADIHETDADMAAGHEAAGVRDRIHSETVAHARDQHPEIADEFTTDAQAETGSGEAQRQGGAGGADATGPAGGQAGGVSPTGTVVPGRGESGPKGFGPPQPEPGKLGPTRKSGLYARVPKRPPSLADWIKARGGIKDDGGDVSAIGVKKPGLIKDTGESADDLARAAEENGFFPELGGERPTVQQFMKKLDDDLHGIYQWSDFDDEAVAAYRDALGHNAEVDRLAAELDIQAKGMSHREFWDTVAERMSQEKAAREVESQAAAAEQAIADAEAAAHEFVETRGDSWEGDTLPEAKPRTLEDLENEHRQAQTARGPISSPADTGDAGVARGGEGEGAGGVGPRGDGAGPVRGTEAEIREVPEPIGSDRPFDSPNPELIDKAGNFNFNNFNMAEDVREAVRASVVRNNEFTAQRRGVITDTELLELADAIGMTPEDAAAWQAGQAANGEELLALGKMSIDHSKVVADLSAKAVRTKDPTDLMALGEAMDRQDMIIRAFSGASAESGRTQRAHQVLKKLGVGDANEIGHLIQANTGRTLDELFQAAQTISKAGTNPSKVAFAVQKMRKPTWVEVAAEVGQAVKLWSPKTWIRNIVGNALALASEVPTHVVTATIGAVRTAARDALGLKPREPAFPTDIPGIYGAGGLGERAYFSEILPGIMGIRLGTMNGLRVAKMVMQDEKFLNKAHSRAEVGFDIGVNEVKSEARVTEAVPGKVGTALRGSFRLMSAMDAVAKGMAYEMKLNQLAARTAVQEGLSGMDLTKRIAELTQSPTIELMAEAKKYADYATFNQELNGFLKSLQSFRSKHPASKFVLWFLRTPVNILKFSAERSVFAPLVKEARENLMGKNGALARDEAMARILVGSAVSYAAFSMAEDGLITGNGPKDPNQRRGWLAAGHKPYSIKWFGHWVSYAGYEPLSTLFGVAADVNEIKHHMTDEDGSKVGQMLTAAMTQNFLSKTYMSSLSDFVEAVNDPVRYGDNYAASFVSGFIPSGIKQVGQSFDPYLRETRGVMDKIMDSVGAGQFYLPPKVDIFGQPIARGPVADAEGPVSRVLAGVLSPSSITPVNEDPLIKTMNRVEYFPAPVDDKINAVKLTPEQQYRYAEVAGKKFKMSAQNLVSDPGFAAIPAHRQRQMLMERMTKARDKARAVVIAESRGGDNDIAAKAKELKSTKRARLDARQ